MTSDMTGFTAIGAEAKRVRGNVILDINIIIYINSSHYATRGAVPLYVQYAEYQHLEDYVAGVKRAFNDGLDGYVRGGIGREPAFILSQLERILGNVNRETRAKYDNPDSLGIPGSHQSNGTVTRPSDFTAYPDHWW